MTPEGRRSSRPRSSIPAPRVGLVSWSTLLGVALGFGLFGAFVLRFAAFILIRCGVGAEAGAEGGGEGDVLLDGHGLGADLAGEAEAFEQGVDLLLGPAVAPEAVEDAAEVLAAVEED